MHRLIAVTIALLLLLAGCLREKDPSTTRKSAEAQRIEKEVARRVETAKTELKTEERGNRLKTIRVVGFVFLSAGAVAGLIRLSQPRFPNPYGRIAPTRITAPAQWIDHTQSPTGRVIDLGSTAEAQPPPLPLPIPGPERRRYSHPPRHRRNHETPPRS